jgi:cell division protease FtsH
MGRGWRFWRRKQALVRQLLVAHMGGPCDDAETVSHTIRPIERVNLQIVLDRWLASDGPAGRLIGYSRESFFGNTGIAQMLLDDIVQAPVQRQQVASSPQEQLDCVMRGLYLLRHAGEPIVVLLSNPDSRFEPPVLELLARRRSVAQEAMKRLLEESSQDLVYKGRTIFLEEEERSGQVQVRFHPLPPTSREALVLPEAVLSVVERNVLGLFHHRELLRRSGRATRHGLLFHGPPGTGKTLMLRYLATSCPDHTVILLTGRQMGLIRESCQIARMLAPSLVLLEDVDLLGEERSANRCPMVLQDLMDEMDGLGPKADVIFLLTTNRPEALEPALSARPGRIDQAIEFPLPDEACRRRLFELYGQGLNLSGLDLDRWIARTEGVSPAFIEELLRKAALMAAERGEAAEPLPLRDADVEKAMDELILFGGELTQKLLGFKPFGFARRV